MEMYMENKNNTWKNEVVNILKELGGHAHLEEIYFNATQRSRKKLSKNFEAVIRQTIEVHSSDSAAFNGKHDLFYSVYGKGNGYWGLR